MIKFILIIVFSYIFISCSNLELYKKIESSAKDYNSHNINKIILSRKGYNPTKKIFYKLKRNLKNDSIIYIYSWKNNALTPKNNSFKALVFDESSKLMYYASLDNDNIKISKNNNLFFEEKQILKEYCLDENLLLIKKYQNQFSSSEIGTSYYIFDIKSSRVILLESIAFDKDGNFFKW